MTKIASPSVVRHLGSLFGSGSAAGLSDRQLLERFVACRDDGGEAAFAALVARHGPMVLGVCRQLHATHNLGAIALLSGKSAAGGPFTVRLQPCGAARARLVDLAGKSVRRSRESYGSHMTMMVVTPGPHHSSQAEADQGRLAADQDLAARFDPVHYAKGLVTDDQGELVLPSLIPGATYRIYDGTMGEQAGPRLRKEFTVKSADSVDLGDVLIERPAT